MQAIALEMNLSETAFVRKSKVADFAARYFTPAEEIPMAGHPTLAVAFGLVDTGRLAVQQEYARFSLELKAGIIPVDIYLQDSKVQRIMMTQKKPEFKKVYPPGEILPVFGLALDDLLNGFPIQTVSTGTPQLMIPLRSPDALRRARLDIPAYLDLRARSDFFSPHLFCLEGATKEGSTFARHFGTPPDTLEDPFTGSATGGMAAYLWHYGLMDRNQFIAEQGHWMKRPGRAYVEIEGARDEIEKVRVGGEAVAVLRGEFVL
jgi:trans-2,3-dihydro-3-hydroxyanthranilate isomerase